MMPKVEAEFTKKISVALRPDQYDDVVEMARRCGISKAALFRHLFDAVNILQKKKDLARNRLTNKKIQNKRTDST
jgi:hypothetical protein